MGETRKNKHESNHAMKKSNVVYEKRVSKNQNQLR